MRINSITQVSGNAKADESELVAVITAAICAASRTGFESKLHIQKIIRPASKRPAWGQAGLNDVMNSRTL